MSSLQNRIQKLLALADTSRNSNLNQAEAAALKAAELIREYNLNPLDFGNKPADDTIIEFQVNFPTFNKVEWQWNLANILAKHNFCTAFYYFANRRRNRPSRIVFVGTRENVDAVIFLYHNMVARFDAECEKQFSLLKLASDFRTHGKQWKNSFLIGAVWGLDEKLSTQKKQFVELAKTSTEGQKQIHALQLVENRLSKHIKENHPDMRHTTSTYNLDYFAYSQGNEFGKKIELQKALG